MTASRDVRSEHRERAVVYPSGNRYRFEKSWHILDDGKHFHCIRVYKNNNMRRPYKYFAWWTEPDGTFVALLS